MKRCIAFIYRLGYPVAKCYWFFRRPVTFGVRCVVVKGDKVLLVRHSYGNRLLTTIGGGVKKAEKLEQAVLREAKEEVGLDLVGVRKVGEVNCREDFKDNTIHVFLAKTCDGALSVDGVEILEANWYRLDSLPPDTSALFRTFIDLTKSYLETDRRRPL